MVWAALLYAIVGTWLTHLIGKPLIGLDFDQQRYEADFRFALVRLRENSEGVALYRGEQEELGNFRDALRQRDRQLVEHDAQAEAARLLHHLLRPAGDHLSRSLVALPRYFSGAIQLGGSDADRLGVRPGAGLALLVHRRLPAVRALEGHRRPPDRLLGVARRACARRPTSSTASASKAPQASLALEGLALALPQGKPLLQPTTLELKPGENVLVTGPSGAGKSTLFRALAGIWPYWKGRIRLPKGARLLFLPQKPYLPIGSLKHAVSYPGRCGAASPTSEVRERARRRGPGAPRRQTSSAARTGRRCSPAASSSGSPSRARCSTKPDWLFLDEATASLPEEDAGSLYRLLKERLPRHHAGLDRPPRQPGARTTTRRLGAGSGELRQQPGLETMHVRRGVRVQLAGGILQPRLRRSRCACRRAPPCRWRAAGRSPR